MDCQQCQTPIDALANIHRVNPGGDGKWVVGWCGQDVHVACLPIHVRACRACWPHNTAFILIEDQRLTAEAAVK